jgi:ABC-type antimicrobial peptide transport system permease subunit
MRFGDSFESAVRAIAANKLRSVLTMLGVVIGVGSVIAMIGIGSGTAKKSIENLEVMGSNMLTIMPNWRRGGHSGGMTDVPGLNREDVAAIKTEVPTVDLITGSVRSNTQAKLGNRSHNTSVVAAEPQVALIRNATKMHAGTWYTAQDEQVAERKCVLGYTVYEELFGGENPVGATIRIKNQNFEVTGVVAYKGGSGFFNPDDQIYIPLKTGMERLLGKTNLDMIFIKCISSELLPITQAKVEEVLGRTRKNATGEELFRVMNQGEAIEQIQTQTRLLSILLASLAGVALLVGGIGIMNIMLVSVTERTREIGLRKAVGARRGSVLWQFLLESIVICLVGGVVGIILGSAGVLFVAQALKVPPVISPQAVVLAFGFSAMVGLFFGFYPAMRASRLQPIEALRHE